MTFNSYKLASGHFFNKRDLEWMKPYVFPTDLTWIKLNHSYHSYTNNMYDLGPDSHESKCCKSEGFSDMDPMRPILLNHKVKLRCKIFTAIDAYCVSSFARVLLAFWNVDSLLLQQCFKLRGCHKMNLTLRGVRAYMRPQGPRLQ